VPETLAPLLVGINGLQPYIRLHQHLIMKPNSLTGTNALTIALIMATPVQWRRRSWALLWGMLLIMLFILFSVAVFIWNESTTVSLVTLSPVWKQIADALEYTLISQLGISFSLPVLIWIAVLFRRQDFGRFAVGGWPERNRCVTPKV
jgi:hypothetical protein